MSNSQDDSQIGQKNVYFAGSILEKQEQNQDNGNQNWDQICWNLALLERQRGGPVERTLLLNVLGLDWEDFKAAWYKGADRRDCINQEWGGILSHDNQLHDVSKFASKFGHSTKGVGPEFVQFSEGRCDLPHWFDPTEEFEIHAEVRRSPKNVEIVPRKYWGKYFEHEWEYCKVRVNLLENGRMEVLMRPKYEGHKYGLNLERYEEYIDYLTGILEALLGFVPLTLLEVVRFDLQQDHECKTYDEQHRRKMVYKMIGLQEYAIWREDKTEANHRREAMFTNKDGVRYTSEAQEVLSNSAAKIESLVEMGKLAKKTRHYTENMVDYQRDFFREQKKFNQATAEFNKEQSDMSDRIESKIDDTMSSVDQSMQVIASAAVDQSRSAQATERWAESVAQSVHATNQVLMEISDTLYEMKEEHKEWREIARGDKLDILSRLKTMDLSFADIHKQVSEQFDVTYQALYQFWNYWQERNDDAELEKRSRKIRHNLKNNDSDLVDEIEQVVEDNPGINTRGIIEKVTGSTNKINDHIRWMVSSGQLHREQYKNSYRHYIDRDDRSTSKNGPAADPKNAVGE